MNKLFKSLILLCAAAPLAVLGVTPDTGKTNSAAKPDSLFADTVVARGKGLEVKRSEVDAEVIHEKTIYASQGAQVAPNIDQQVLKDLIVKKILLNKASDADRAKAKETYQSNLQKFKTNNHLTDEQFNQKIAQQLVIMGISREEFEKQNLDSVTVTEVLQRELKVNVTEDDIKKFYNDHLAKFEQPEMVRAAHILVMTRTNDPATMQPEQLPDDQKQAKHKQMEDILKRARAGEDFAKLAAQYSEDPGSKDRGGEYTFAHGEMMPAFETAAFALKTNEISDIVTTVYGYHIIKLLGKSPAATATLDDEVVFLAAPKNYVIIKKDWIGDPAMLQAATKLSQLIRDNLEAEQRQIAIPSYIEKLQKDADVEILDPSLKPAEVAPEIPAGHPALAAPDTAAPGTTK